MESFQLKIALVSQEYPPETAFGGIGSQTFQKATLLCERGHSVIVISHSRDQNRHEEWQGQVKVIRTPGSPPALTVFTEAARWIAYSTQVASCLSQLSETENLDLIDFPEWGGEGFVCLLNRTEWNYVPVVVQLHGPTAMFAHRLGWPELDSEFYRVAVIMEETSVRLCDRVFSSSACSAKWAEQYYGLNTADVPILHTGVDISLFRPLEVPKDQFPSVVFVGKIARNKGINALVEAACRLAPEFPELRVKVAGRGNEALREELLKKAEAKGFSELFRFLGYVSRDELPAVLGSSHLFVAPSVYEGGPGFVYLEAMACGLPVIGCEGSGVAEVISNGENGVLVEPDNVDQLTIAMRNLLSDPAKLSIMGRKALEYVIRDVDNRTCTKKIEEFYQETVRRSRGGLKT